MTCPYRKKVKVYYDGTIKVTEVDFMECVKEKCTFWGITKRINKLRQECGLITRESIGSPV